MIFSINRTNRTLTVYLSMQPLPILDISKFLFAGKKEDFYSNTLAAHIKEHHQHINKPHKHNSYLVVLFTKGSGVHEVDFNSYKVKPGSVFLLNPGQTHHWELSDDIDGYIFLHTANYYNQPYSHNTIDSFPFFYSTQNSPCIYLKKKDEETIKKLFVEILNEFDSNLVLKYRKICSLMDILYIELSRIYLGGNYTKVVRSSNYSIKLKQLEQFINIHFAQLKSPAEYASRMNMSTKHLNRITQSLLGKSTSDLITDRVLLEAKRMLIHSENTISEIAELLGYSDYSYFSRLFKNKCGETPSDFAKHYH
jgi:AraC family transcriptional activator of pobA